MGKTSSRTFRMSHRSGCYAARSCRYLPLVLLVVAAVSFKGTLWAQVAPTTVTFAGTTPVALGSGFSSPTGVAVDAAGDVFVADSGNSAVKEIVAVDGSIPANNPTILT